MPIDITDQCLYIRAVASDIDGSHHGDPGWFLSPDVVMTNSDPGFAKEGVTNTTNVTVNWKRGCALETELSSVVFDLYVCTPALNITTNVGSSVQLAASKTVPGITAGGPPVTVPVTWTPISDTTQPNGHGHRCLIARCYPFGASPDATNLSKYVLEDKHYAQHNITIDVSEAMMRKISVRTGNAGKRAERVAIQVMQDFQPNEGVLRGILPSLQAVPSFRRISNKPVRHMALDFTAFEENDGDLEDILEHVGHVIRDRITGLFGGHHRPNIQAKMLLPPGVFADISFNVDVSGSDHGDAHVFHLTQTNAAGQIEGALTVATVTP